MKRSLIIGTTCAVIIASGIGGYCAGLRSGIELARGSHAIETGAVAVAELDLLESGRTDKARLFLEAGVDDGLMGWSELTSTRARLSEHIFGSGLPPFDDERFVRRLAQYRKVHRSPWAVPAGLDAAKSVEPDSVPLLNLRPLKERDAKIAAVVAQYAP
jgi:hypothetical protein